MSEGADMNSYDAICDALRKTPRRWVVTGSAGFIGSHLLEILLRLNQRVVSLDSFATGFQRNLDEVRKIVGEDAWRLHQFLEADITDFDACRRACAGADVVLHQAALGSVPRSLEDPLRTHAANVTGFINMLVAARDSHVSRVVFAASSSTYGDSPGLPKVEEVIGRPLSPYAATKLIDEIYADVFGHCYGLSTIGLRYFNVFGARQDPDGAYAAVIPRWVDAMLGMDRVVIHGDGETTRDFCHIENVVRANILAASAPVRQDARVGIFNVAVGQQTSLNELFSALRGMVGSRHPELSIPDPVYQSPRDGDIRHSLADITKARIELGFVPVRDLRMGLAEALPWYETRAGESAATRRMTGAQ